MSDGYRVLREHLYHRRDRRCPLLEAFVLDFLEPLWAGIFSGLFALLGAVIGGKFVLRSMKIQRSLDQLAAGRALSTELEMNLTAMATLAIVGRANPLEYLTPRPLYKELL